MMNITSNLVQLLHKRNFTKLWEQVPMFIQSTIDSKEFWCISLRKHLCLWFREKNPVLHRKKKTKQKEKHNHLSSLWTPSLVEKLAEKWKQNKICPVSWSVPPTLSFVENCCLNRQWITNKNSTEFLSWLHLRKMCSNPLIYLPYASLFWGNCTCLS